MNRATSNVKYPYGFYGFTLIELAVVLVIISLLIGGLAGLKSYTKNAELITTINQSKYYTNAFNQFQNQYGAPPGDFKTASASWTTAASAGSTDGTNHNGDGNGLVDAGLLPAEQYYAFQHLALSGYIQGSYTGASSGTGGGTIDLNIPKLAIQKTSLIFDHPDEADGNVFNATLANATYFDGLYGNVLIIAGLNDASATVPNLPFLTPKDALKIDDKYDDAQPGQGNIVTPKSGVLANCASSNLTTATYVTTSDTTNCYLILKIQ